MIIIAGWCMWCRWWGPDLAQRDRVSWGTTVVPPRGSPGRGRQRREWAPGFTGLPGQGLRRWSDDVTNGEVCIDAFDPRAQAAWWDQVLDDVAPDPDDDGSDGEAGLRGPAGRWLQFLKIPEQKTLKNRIHICVRAVDRTRDEEVDRLLALGAIMVDDLRQSDSGWAVLADPEGNEFCVLTLEADAAGLTR